jgi:hypothetical protein
MTEVVNFRPALDARGSESWSINGGARTDLHVILDDHSTNMWEMLKRPRAGTHETKAPVSDDRARLENAIAADSRSRMYRDIRVQRGAVTDDHIISHKAEWSDRYAGTNLCRRVNPSRAIYSPWQPQLKVREETRKQTRKE